MPPEDWLPPRVIAGHRNLEVHLARLERVIEAYARRAPAPSIVPMRRPWTHGEVELLSRNYADSRTDDIATVLGRPLDQVYAKAKRLGLAKSNAYLASPAACRLRREGDVGKAYRFPKDHVPANKGLHQPGWAAGRMRETQFKPGTRAGVAGSNWKPVGAYRIDSEGILLVKVSDVLAATWPVNWRYVHKQVWEAANGPIPEGHVVRFRDGMRTADPKLLTVDRLELLTLAENLARNRLPPELQKLSQLRGVLTRTINRKAKETA